MPLNLVVDSLDSVPEALRGEYAEKDGKFHLNVEGLEDTGGLKKALESERKARAEREKQAKAWEKLGKSPDEIAELLGKLETDETERLKKKGDFDAILQQHTDKWNKERDGLTGEVEAARANERRAVVDGALAAALARENANESGLSLLPAQLGKNVVVETVDGKRVVKITNDDGTPMAGSGPGGLATIDDLVKAAKTAHPALFKANGAGGSGKDPKDGPAIGGITSKAQFKNERDRAAWVEKNGFQAYTALPD
jgi:hypothetical protein